MSINVEVNKKQLSKDLTIHYLPASIEGDGEANVEEYFSNYTVRKDAHFTNAMRGFPLDGVEFEVPAKLKGVVFQETQFTLNESADRLLRVSGIFNKFMYWNYDKVPSTADPLKQAMQLVSITDELSKPISSEDMEKEMKK